jgi:Ca2+-binding EF-hand superfamily protein
MPLLFTGQMSFKEFSKLITTKLAEKDSREEIFKAFKLFDRDQAGKITVGNLQQIAAELGEGLTEEEIKVIRHLLARIISLK